MILGASAQVPVRGDACRLPIARGSRRGGVGQGGVSPDLPADPAARVRGPRLLPVGGRRRPYPRAGQPAAARRARRALVLRLRPGALSSGRRRGDAPARRRARRGRALASRRDRRRPSWPALDRAGLAGTGLGRRPDARGRRRTRRRDSGPRKPRRHGPVVARRLLALPRRLAGPLERCDLDGSRSAGRADRRDYGRDRLPFHGGRNSPLPRLPGERGPAGCAARRPGVWLLYAPLLVPQIAFLFGVQIALVRLELDGTLLAVAWTHLVFVLPSPFCPSPTHFGRSIRATPGARRRSAPRRPASSSPSSCRCSCGRS